jgi:WD40 repeat protein/serine/threonine protein kinase
LAFRDREAAMNSPNGFDIESLSFEAERRIDAVCQRFEDAWKAINPPRLEDFLGEAAGPERSVLLRELLRLELDYRRRNGDTPDLAKYLPRFPEDAALIREDFERGRRTRELSTPPPDGATPATIPLKTPGGGTSPNAARLPSESVPLGYEYMGKLGRGGQADVLKAWQIRLKREVALKVLRESGTLESGELERFRRDAEALAQLHHPNIVQVWDVGEHEGKPFFSMEYCDGGSLDKYLAGTPVPAHEAATLVETLALAMHAAHQRGMVHRDLKPANVLLSPWQPAENGLDSGKDRLPLSNYVPKITDFGFAKKLDDGARLSVSGMVMGTPEYMPPEQAQGRSKEAGPPADVYALGAILYECLTGRPPFKAATQLDTLLQVVNDEPVPPNQLQPKTPRDLETVCLKCLNKKPHERYPNAEDLAEDLRRFLEGRPIQARPVSRRERALKWVRRRPALAVLAALLVLVSLAGFAGVSWQWLRAEGEYQKAADLAEARGRTAHARSIALAYAEWRAGNAGRAEQMLAECRPELCGWEWHYLRRLFRVRQLATRDAHARGVLAVAFSPDGRRVASAGADGTVKVWDGRGLSEMVTLRGHSAAVSAVLFSANGRRLASGGADGTVRVWNAVKGKELARWLAHKGGVTGLAFDPKGRHLASTGGQPFAGEVKLWNATTGKALAGKTWNHLLAAVAISPDGAYLATAGHDDSVALWHAATLKPIGTFQSQHQHFVSWGSVAFSADGTRIAAGSPNGLVRVWDRATGKEFFSALTPTEASVHGLAFCGRDSHILVAATADNTILGWYTRSGRPAFTFRGHKRLVTGVACSPDGRRLVSGSLDGTLKQWDLSRRDDELTLRPANEGVTGVAFSPDGRRLAAATRDKAVKVWDLATGETVFKVVSLPAPVNSLAFHPDGGQLASAGGDGLVRLWEVPAGRGSRCLRGHRGPVQAVAFRPDGRRLASAGQDGVARVWDAATGREVLALDGHGGPVQAVAFSPDGRHLATAGEDGVTRVWGAATGREVLALDGHGGPVHAVAFSLDGRHLAAAGEDGVTRVWGAATGGLTRTLRGHAGAVRGLAYSPKGRLASVGDDKAVRLWDPAGQELLALRGHTEPLRAVAFSQDGHRLATASDDGTIKVLDGTPLEGASAGGG